MSYSKEIKNIALFKLAKNISITEICTELNISKSTIYRWQKENKAEIENIRASLLIKKLIRNKHIIEALDYCEEERFKDYFLIQKQRITCLIKLRRTEEALALCEEERFKDYFPIQNRRITCLINLGRIEEALALCEEERFKDYFPIQNQRITYLTDLGRIDEALALYEEERFNACPANKKQNVAKNTIKKETISEASLNSIFLCLTKSRLDIAFKLLKVYLKNINCTNLEFLIIDLIRLSVLEKDSPFFTRPMMILSLISQNKYTFNIEVYIADFHDALKNAEIKEAEIYLDIIKRGANIVPVNSNLISELEKLLDEYKKTADDIFPLGILEKITEVRNKQSLVLLPPLDKATTKKIYQFCRSSNDLYVFKKEIKGKIQLLIKYQAPYEYMDIPRLLKKIGLFYQLGQYNNCIESGNILIINLKHPNSYIFFMVGMSYLNLGQLEPGLMYLKIAQALNTDPAHNYENLISRLEEELALKEGYQETTFEKIEFAFNDYGIPSMNDILIMVLEENINIEDACNLIQLSPIETLIAKILLAREYYAEGLDFLAEKLLNEVAVSPNKNSDIENLLNETLRNKKLYRNKGSILARLKES